MMTTTQTLIDQYLAAVAQAEDIARHVKNIREQVIALGIGRHDGTYKAVSVTLRTTETPDETLRQIRERAFENALLAMYDGDKRRSDRYIRDHTKRTESYTVRECKLS